MSRFRRDKWPRGLYVLYERLLVGRQTSPPLIRNVFIRMFTHWPRGDLWVLRESHQLADCPRFILWCPRCPFIVTPSLFNEIAGSHPQPKNLYLHVEPSHDHKYDHLHAQKPQTYSFEQMRNEVLMKFPISQKRERKH